MDNMKMGLTITVERRQCLVNGRRAFFHRWADSARPVLPRGMEEIDAERQHQLWNVHGIVEYEDGTVQRVWPSEIQFIDGGGFDEYYWPDMEHPASGDQLTEKEQDELQRIKDMLQTAEDAARESGLLEG